VRITLFLCFIRVEWRGWEESIIVDTIIESVLGLDVSDKGVERKGITRFRLVIIITVAGDRSFWDLN
jgi:hypothetical protein